MKGLSMIDTTETNELTREERIRSLAYSLWEQEGCPEGRAEAHWLKACEIVDAEERDPEWLQRIAPESSDKPTPAGVFAAVAGKHRAA